MHHMPLLKAEIEELVTQVFEEATRLRRLFHENPELGYEEHHTSRVISDYLSENGIEVKKGIAGTGVLGILRGQKPGPVIALRSDMDALPIQEQTSAPFSSKVQNVMHACGHDMHMAMLLGAAKALAMVRDRIEGTIKFIFQPAEEMLAGGKRMVEEGALSEPDVDCIYGFHVWPDLPIGKFGFKSGPLMASMDSFSVTLKGKAGHGAAPHQGIDAIIGGAHVISGLQSIISRETDPLDSVVLTIGTLSAGTGFNIIPEKATFQGTVRTLKEDVRQRVAGDFSRVVEGMSSAMRLEPEINYQFGYPVTSNQKDHTDFAKGQAIGLFGEQAAVVLEQPSMVSEDFSFYLQQVPGSFILLGVGDGAGGSYKLHNERFLPDEEAMKYGIGLYLAIAAQSKHVFI